HRRPGGRVGPFHRSRQLRLPRPSGHLRRRAAKHSRLHQPEHRDQSRPRAADGPGPRAHLPRPARGVRASVLALVFPVVIGTVAWYYLFSNVHGGINYLLLQAHLVPESIAWLGLGPLPMASSITVNVWHGTALFGVLLLAALRSVPADVLDAAVIDGARPVRRFMEVVLPYLSSALPLGTVLSVVGTVGDFAIVHLLTGGGPANETTIVSTMAFQLALRDGALGVGAAAALSMVPVY